MHVLLQWTNISEIDSFAKHVALTTRKENENRNREKEKVSLEQPVAGRQPANCPAPE